MMVWITFVWSWEIWMGQTHTSLHCSWAYYGRLPGCSRNVQGSSAAVWTDLCNRAGARALLLLPVLAHVTWRLPVSLGPSFPALASRVAFSPSRQHIGFLTTSPPTLPLPKHIAHRSKIVTVALPSDLGLSIPKFQELPSTPSQK